MKKTLLLGLSSILLVASMLITWHTKKRLAHSSPQTTYTIGIIKTASHPALDLACQGFIDELALLPGAAIKCIVQDAQGSASMAHQIAQSYKANSDIDAIYAIATPALQAAASVERNKPIIYSAVTDPASLGLSHLTNICGASDMVNISDSITMLTTLLPNLKRVALLYNPGETNSTMLIEKMSAELTARNITPLRMGINNASEIRTATLLASAQADAILAPTDNTVAAALPAVATLALQMKKPLVISWHSDTLPRPLAACGVDYKEQGMLAAQYAIKTLLKKCSPNTLPVAKASCSTVLSKSVMDKLGVTLPAPLKDKVVVIKN